MTVTRTEEPVATHGPLTELPATVIEQPVTSEPIVTGSPPTTGLPATEEAVTGLPVTTGLPPTSTDIPSTQSRTKVPATEQPTVQPLLTPEPVTGMPATEVPLPSNVPQTKKPSTAQPITWVPKTTPPRLVTAIPVVLTSAAPTEVPVTCDCQHTSLPSGMSSECTHLKCVIGLCLWLPVHDGKTCNGGQCSSGRCEAADLCTGVVCVAQDTCHLKGLCNAGVCSHPIRPEGATCTTSTSLQGMCAKGECRDLPITVTVMLRFDIDCTAYRTLGKQRQHEVQKAVADVVAAQIGLASDAVSVAAIRCGSLKVYLYLTGEKSLLVPTSAVKMALQGASFNDSTFSVLGTVDSLPVLETTVTEGAEAVPEPDPCGPFLSGPNCTVCSPLCLHIGGSCTPSGTCKMCNNKETYDATDHWVDSCGVCGPPWPVSQYTNKAEPNSACMGCDGRLHSDKRMDSCSVCGGNNDCKVAELVDTNTVEVTFVWGIDSARSYKDRLGEHVVYDKEFNPSDVRCQQHLLDSCRHIAEKVACSDNECGVPAPAQEGADQSAQFECLLQSFETWVREKRTTSAGLSKYPLHCENRSCAEGLPLPSSVFEEAIQDWLFEDRRDVMRYFGFYGALSRPWVTRKLKFIMLPVRTTTDIGESAYSLLQRHNAWDETMDALNHGQARGCLGYQTAPQWPPAFVQVTAINGLAYAIAISLLTSFVIVLMFTCHVWITTLILVTMGSIISGTFSVFWMMGWKVGAVEAVSLSVVIGLSVDYCLHFAEAYTEVCAYVRREGIPFSSEEVLRKVVGDMGPPLVNAAATTILSTVPLLFCTIRPLVQFGQIMVISIGVSIVFSVFLFVPLLLVLGPRPFKKTLRVRLVAVILPALLIAIFFAVVYASGTPIVGPDGEPLVG
eukprot:TRINITY_DN7420_c0_g2_i1.p1 TRINITY_DN7420_c0_g2~~TRINITY_DN7420_c0_g2_i1.p1  ORF type:complete len:898 (+),score=155.07 TRINITY_DN7420_c0_g2_i1:396-3089(+)